MTKWTQRWATVFSLLCVGVGACGTEAAPAPAPWSAPDLLIVDYSAGLFRLDAGTAEPRPVVVEGGALAAPRRAMRLDDGRIVIVTTGDDTGKGRGLFWYDPKADTIEPWIDLSTAEGIPTDLVQTGPTTLLMSTRKIEADKTLNSSALHQVDMRDGSVELLLEVPELVAVLSLYREEGGKSVLVMDGDADPLGQEHFEGVLDRYHLDSHRLDTVRVFENTVSPLQLHPLAGTALEGEADFLLVDVNALHPPERPWVGKLFLMNAAEGEVRPFLVAERQLIDPVRGFLHDGRLIVAEMSSNPGNYDGVKTEVSYARFPWRGAIYTVDLASKDVQPLVHSPLFIDPVDVLAL